MTKPYKARSLKGAEAQVRNCRKQIRQRDEVIDRLIGERNALAKLAADGPQFNNPIEAMAAKKIRDEVLKRIIR